MVEVEVGDDDNRGSGGRRTPSEGVICTRRVGTRSIVLS